MRTDDMLPIAEKLDQVGYWSVEMWGGATFDSAMRFLNEDPWERIRKLKAKMPNTPFQMLLRGQNVVGYKHYPDDVLERFVVKAHENGIDVFRIFDALNDVRNMRRAMEVVKREGAHAQGTICYTISPVHDIDTFVEMAHVLEDMGADTICVKDMAGLLSPYVAYELVGRLKAEIRSPSSCTPTTPAAWPWHLCSRPSRPAWTLWTRPSPRWPWSPPSRRPRRWCASSRNRPATRVWT